MTEIIGSFSTPTSWKAMIAAHFVIFHLVLRRSTRRFATLSVDSAAKRLAYHASFPPIVQRAAPGQHDDWIDSVLRFALLRSSSMSDYVFPPPPQPSVPVVGDDARFPVRRIFCIGRNYEEHAREMEAPVSIDSPVFFMKPADAVVSDGADVPYPPCSNSLHHEVELVVALRSGGRDLDPAEASAAIFGYAVGLDLTRRDLQAEAKAKGGPWDTAKGFDASAPIGAITPVVQCGHPASGELRLDVNGTIRQRADIASMVLSPREILVALSKLFSLRAGDLIYTGTPAGVAPLQRGDSFLATFPGLAALRGRIV